jgi:hypothetical protein
MLAPASRLLPSTAGLLPADTARRAPGLRVCKGTGVRRREIEAALGDVVGLYMPVSTNAHLSAAGPGFARSDRVHLALCDRAGARPNALGQANPLESAAFRRLVEAAGIEPASADAPGRASTSLGCP